MNLIPDESWPGRIPLKPLLLTRGADPELPSLDVLQSIPEHLMERYQLAPLAVSDTRMQLGMVDPLNLIARDDIHLITGLEVDPVLVSREFAQGCLAKLRGQGAQLPIESFRIRARVCGPMASVETELVFSNPCLEATEFSLDYPVVGLLRSVEIGAGRLELHSEVRSPAECREPGHGPSIDLQREGRLEIRRVRIPGAQETRVKIRSVQWLEESALGIPLLELAGVPGEMEVWLEEVPRTIGCTQHCWMDGCCVRLKRDRLPRDFVLRWEALPVPALYTEDGFFVAWSLPELEDRGLNFLPETLTTRPGRSSGRHLGRGGVAGAAPVPLDDFGLALLWASEQASAPLGMAVELGYLTEHTVLVLVDEQGRGGCLPAGPKLESSSQDQGVVRAVDAMLTQAVLEGATSIHLRYQESSFTVMFRTCGRLHLAMQPPNSMFGPMLTRLLSMAGITNSLHSAAKGTFELTCEGHEVDGSLYFQPFPRAQMVITLSPRLARQLPALGNLEPRSLTLVAAPDFRVRERLVSDFMLDLKGISVVRCDRAGLLSAAPHEDLEVVVERVDADNLIVDATLTPELARAVLRLARRCRVVLFLRSETACEAVEELALLGDPWWTADVLQMVVVASARGVEVRPTDEQARDCLRSANWRFRLRGAGVW